MFSGFDLGNGPKMSLFLLSRYFLSICVGRSYTELNILNPSLELAGTYYCVTGSGSGSSLSAESLRLKVKLFNVFEK